MVARYAFLVDTYQTERLKVLSVWSMFRDEDLPFRPHPTDARGRSVREQMIHQCVSENGWFRNMLGLDLESRPLPEQETRIGFLQEYAQDSARRLALLRGQEDGWWEEVRPFFDVQRPRTWIMVRRIAHTAHHRGQQTALLRMLGRSLHSTYGPSADTGGLMQHKAPTLYAYPDENALIEGEIGGGAKSVLPGPGATPLTERAGE